MVTVSMVDLGTLTDDGAAVVPLRALEVGRAPKSVFLVDRC